MTVAVLKTRIRAAFAAVRAVGHTDPVTGEQDAADKLGEAIFDEAGGAIHDPAIWPRFSVHRNSVAQNNMAQAGTLVLFTNAIFNDGSGFALDATSRFTVPIGADGTYLFTPHLRFKNMTIGDRVFIELRVGGVIKRVDLRTTHSTSIQDLQLSMMINLVATNYVQLFAGNVERATSDLNTAPTVLSFDGSRIA